MATVSDDIYSMTRTANNDVDQTTLNLATQQYEFEDDALAGLDTYLTGHRRDTTLEDRRAQFSSEWLRDRMRPRPLASAKDIFQYARTSYDQFMPTVLFAVVLGATCGAVGAGSDYAITWLVWCRTVMLRDLGTGPLGWWTNYLIWIVWCLLLGSGGMAFGYWTPECTGGGTPELRAMLTGRLMPKLLELRMIVSKYFGVILILSAGCIAGKQGPMANICVGIAYQMMWLPYFRRFYSDSERRYEILGAGIGTSAAANFLAPFSGSLWGYEFSSSHATVRLYWFTFISCVSAAIVYRFLSFETTWVVIDLPRNAWRWELLYLCALTGIVCGLVCSFQIRLFEFIVKTRRRLTMAGTNGAQKLFFKRISKPYIYGFLVLLCTGIITYPGSYAFLGLGIRATLTQLWSIGKLGSGSLASWSSAGGVLPSLLLFFATRYTLYTIGASMPAPYGTFAPSLIIGAVIGRFIGEVVPYVSTTWNGVDWDEPTDSTYVQYYPAVLAICGSAAYISAFSKMFSLSLFILEMSGQYSLIIPSMVTCAASFLTQNYLSDSFYDMMCRVRGLSWVPPVPDRLRSVPVGQFMTRDPGAVHSDCSANELLHVLQKHQFQRYFPVVDQKSYHPAGYASRRDLLVYLIALNSAETHSERLRAVDEQVPVAELHDKSTDCICGCGLPQQLVQARRFLYGTSSDDKFPLQRVPVTVNEHSPLSLVQLLVIRYEQPVVVVCGHDGRLSGMVTREQVIAAIGYRRYFRVLRGLIERTLRMIADGSVPRRVPSTADVPDGPTV